MDNPDIDIDMPDMAPAPKRPKPVQNPEVAVPDAAAAAAPSGAATNPRPQSAGVAASSPAQAKAAAGAKGKAGSKTRAPAAAARRKAPSGARGTAADNQLVTPDAAPEPVVSEGRGQFSRELTTMMYGFGDALQPEQESVDLLEDITVAYLMEVGRRASSHAAARGEAKVAPEDVMLVVRKDPRKLARIRELLLLEKEVKAAKNPLKNLEGVPDDLEVGGEGEEGEEGGMDE